VAAIAAEKMRRAEIRRPWLAMAGVCLALGAITSTIFAVKSSWDRDAARHQALLAQRVNAFLTIDLLSRTNPRVSGIADETLIEAAERAEADVSARFADDPEIAASIYAALASAFQARTAYGPARIASDNGVRAYRSLEGPNSPRAAILRLNRASMEAYIHTPETLKTANQIVAEEERRLPELRARRAEAEVALHIAKGAIAMGVADGTTALAEFQAAQRLAAAAPDSLDADGRLRLRYREAQAQIMLYHYADAAKAFADVAADQLARHGPRFADTLTTQMQEAEALGEVGDSARALQLINAIYPAMTEVLGSTHSSVLAALEVRGDALMALGRFAEAAKAFQTLYDAAASTGSANPMFVVDGLAELGHAKCRGGDTKAGLDTVARAASAAGSNFGVRSSVAAGVAAIQIECLIKAGQFAAARQALSVVDRDAANAVLPDSYAGESFDLYDAAVAHALGDDTNARARLAPLLKFFAGGTGNPYHRRWAGELAVALAPVQN